jgi:uncharacterized repeat protein (TIGR03803 family)
VQANDGKFYGMTLAGTNRAGFIFSFDPSTSSFTNLVTLDSASGYQPYGSLVQANNGKLYGMTSSGGIANAGVIFSFDPVTFGYTKLKDFDATNGSRPYGSLLQATDGKLYGLTSGGGIFGAGIIFSIDPVTAVFTKIKDFDGTSGRNPYGSLLQANNGNLYGMTSSGGTAGMGVIFSLNPATLSYSKLKDLDGINGSHPYGNLIQATNGKLYGLTNDGGNSAYGVIFSFDPVSAAFTKIKDFGNTDGNYPYGSLLQASDGKIYGMTHDGGSNGPFSSFGAIFSFDLISAAYSVLGNFVADKGGSPYYGALIERASIITSSLNSSSFCAGSSITVAYTANGLYSRGNTFTAQLSSATGSFSNPVNIGTLSSTSSGTINAILPANTATGTLYRIRVVANYPATTGSDNGSNITINALPAAYLAPYGDVCITDPPFTLTGGAPAGGTYSGKGVTNNQFDPAAVGAGKFTITYTFKNSAGCTAATRQTISVAKTCVACKAGITSSGPTTFCQGQKVTLYASGGISYLWSNGATTQKITVSSTGSYSVKVTDANKCAANSMPVAVTVNELPATPVITPGGNTSFCIPGSVTLATSAATSYLWSNGANTQSIIASTSGTYSVTVANGAGCIAASAGIVVTAKKCNVYCPSNGSSENLGYIQNVVTSNGISNNSGWNNGYADFTRITGKSSLYSDFTLNVSPGFISGSNQLYTSVWIDWNQNGDFNDAGDLVFAPQDASDLDQTTTVMIPKTAFPGFCTMRIIMSAEPVTGACDIFKYGEVEDYTIYIAPAGARTASLPLTGFLDQPAETIKFSVFPNPAKDRLQLRLSAIKQLLPAGSNALLQLIDINGKILLQTKLTGAQQYIDISRFSNGIYFLLIKNQNTSFTKKIFIQH